VDLSKEPARWHIDQMNVDSTPAWPVVELRQYELRPRQRDVLIELFERELIEPQKQAGMDVIGQFSDRADPDRFVWLRGFADLRARRNALAAFYEGPSWEAHRDAANATMLDSDNVLLLRPARADAAFRLDERPLAGGESVVAATIAYLEPESADEAAAVDAFESTIAPEVAAVGGAVLGYFVTEPAANDYPRLPVREGVRVVAWFAGFGDASALEAADGSIEAAVDTALTPLRSVARIEHLVLVPTRGSRLTGRTLPCRPIAQRTA
jgi:hypothetical protein